MLSSTSSPCRVKNNGLALAGSLRYVSTAHHHNNGLFFLAVAVTNRGFYRDVNARYVCVGVGRVE